ncbi:MAG: hypothetical protein ABR875_03030 [Minisyncoccia bacterium]
MRSAITSLPLSPRKNAMLGYYSIPLMVDLLGKMCNQETILALNCLGCKADQIAIEEFGSSAYFLGLRGQIWQDDNESNKTFVSSVLYQGLSDGWIKEEPRGIWRCGCGKTEVLDEPDNFTALKSDRIYEITNGKITCRACSEHAENSTEQVLLLCLPIDMKLPQVIPRYAECEFSEQFNFFRGKSILISRKFGAGFKTRGFSKDFILDVDFCWMFYLAALWKNGFSVDTVCTGHKTLKQAVLSTIASQLAGIKIPRFIVSLPYVNIDFAGKEIVSTGNILSDYRPNVIRYFLGLVLGNRSKEVSLPSRLLYLIEHSIIIPDGVLKKPVEAITPVEIWHGCNQQELIKISKKLRRGEFTSLSNMDKRVLWAILSL